jgi:hypothetical protein
VNAFARRAWASAVEWVMEYLTLRIALEDAARLSGDRRDALVKSIEEARQKRDAAEYVVRQRARAEAIGLATDGARRMTDCAKELEGSRMVNVRRVRRAVEQLEGAMKAVSLAPTLDAEVTRAQRRALHTMLATELSLGQWLRDALLDRRELGRLRLQRAVTAALVVASPLMGVAFVKHSFLGPMARASSVLDEQYTADRVLDGDPDTEWVAGGGDEWLELHFHERAVHTVSVLNGGTLPDRAVKEIQVDFYSHASAIAGQSRTFDKQYPAQWQTIQVGGVRCDRVRIAVKSHYGSGAAIAEVKVE